MVYANHRPTYELIPAYGRAISKLNIQLSVINYQAFAKFILFVFVIVFFTIFQFLFFK